MASVKDIHYHHRNPQLAQPYVLSFSTQGMPSKENVMVIFTKTNKDGSLTSRQMVVNKNELLKALTKEGIYES